MTTPRLGGGSPMHELWHAHILMQRLRGSARPSEQPPAAIAVLGQLRARFVAPSSRS